MSSWVAILGVLLSAAFAVDRGMSWHLAERRTRDAERRLLDTEALVARHPGAFGARGSDVPRAGGPKAIPLKGLVLDAAAREGLQVAFLTESEKEAGRGKRETLILGRLARAPQAGLVRFLGRLENEGGGARIRELRLRPSREVAGLHDEAEFVLARAALQAAPGGEGKR